MGPNHPVDDYFECGALDVELESEYRELFGDRKRLNKSDALDFLNKMSEKHSEMSGLYPAPVDMINQAEQSSRDHWFYRMNPE